MSGALTDTSIVAGASNPTGYTIDQSVRIEKGSKLQKTISGDGNKTTWTWSGWTKNAFDWTSNADNTLFSAKLASPYKIMNCYFRGQLPNTYFEVSQYYGSYTTQLHTLAKYRDPAAWLHVVVVWDTDNGTETDRLRFYINGERVTAFGTGGTSPNYPASGEESFINDDAMVQTIGEIDGDTTTSIDSYLAEVHFIDGQALTGASFGEVNEDTNQWVPIKYEGTYGTKGYYLKFEDSADFGNDSSGNGNDYTSTALAATDQMVDSPTNNFCVLNPVQGENQDGDDRILFKEGNLLVEGDGSWNNRAIGTFPIRTGKWYWEIDFTLSITSWNEGRFGICTDDSANDWGHYTNETGTFWYYAYDGKIWSDSAYTSYGATFTTGDIIGVALNMDDSEITFYKNGTTQGTISLTGSVSTSYSVIPFVGIYDYNSEPSKATANFGQDSSFAGEKTAQGNADSNAIGDFYYPVPAGFLALCTSNLPAPSIAISGENFNPVIYTGNAAASHAVTGVGFQPDLTWLKKYEDTDKHTLYDAVRTATKYLTVDTNAAEVTEGTSLKSFDSDGFTVGDWDDVNGNGSSFVSWNWLANGSGSSNTTGTIDSTVSANTAAGFSIATYTGNQTSGATVGHGLSVAPDLVIIKMRTATGDWNLGMFSVALMGNTRTVQLNDTAVSSVSAGYWNNTTPTATVFTLGDADIMNGANDYVAYCFHSVEGYSRVGKWQGNGQTDGSFIYTGFRPAMVLSKDISSANNWGIVDDARNTYNVANSRLRPNTTAAQSTDLSCFDFVSNGFKLRTTDGDFNSNTYNYIYVAFAEFPFKYSNAR